MPDALVDGYDLVILDLDGVVYVGEQAVPHAAEALAELRRRGIPTCYLTNNASRSATAVAELLTGLGMPATPADVVTSAQASAQLLAERFPAGSPILVVGSDALAAEVAAVGLRPVHTADDSPVAVIQGYGPNVGWRHLAEATRAVRAGARWVVTNRDRTLPSPHGPLPGNGALVAALATALDREPDEVVGKPSPEIFRAAADRYGARRPLVIGDRLDTDIEGAVRAGFDSVLVLTGVATPADALAAEPVRRPTYLATDLSDLTRPYPAVVPSGDEARCRRWRAWVTSGRLVLAGEGDPLDALRVLSHRLWSVDRKAGSDIPPVSGETDAAQRVVKELGLSGV